MEKVRRLDQQENLSLYLLPNYYSELDLVETSTLLIKQIIIIVNKEMIFIYENDKGKQAIFKILWELIQ